MTEDLTGYEASELERIAALLDAEPVSAEGLYYDTIAFHPRAIGVAAAMQAVEGGHGGSQPMNDQWAEYNGTSAVEVAGFGGTDLAIGSLGAGEPLLDISSPSSPTVVTAGIYAVTAMVMGHGLPEGESFHSILHLDAEDRDAVAWMSGIGDAGVNDIRVSGACTFFIPAGGVIRTRVNNGSANPNDFSLNELIVQRIS